MQEVFSCAIPTFIIIFICIVIAEPSCYSGKTDLIFIIDSSSTVSTDDFTLLQDWLQRLVEAFDTAGKNDILYEFTYHLWYSRLFLLNNVSTVCHFQCHHSYIIYAQGRIKLIIARFILLMPLLKNSQSVRSEKSSENPYADYISNNHLTIAIPTLRKEVA